MDIEKHLIFIKGEEKTKSISYCVFKEGKWQVAFGGEKIYSYNYHNVQWFKNPKLLNPASTIILQKGQPLSGVDKIFVFENYIRICFTNGYNNIYSRQEITVEQNILNSTEAKNCLEYLKQLAEHISITDEDESSFLGRQYQKISQVNAIREIYVSSLEDLNP